MLARARSVLLALTAAWPRPAAAQAGAAPVGVGSEAAAEAIEGAWAAQARFERDRIRCGPLSTAAAACATRSSGDMCFRHDEGGDWYPGPEDPRTRAAREGLIGALAEAGALAPEDPWVAGQHVFYLGEAGRWEEALERARACTIGEAWCAALQGLALHALGRFPEAGSAFLRALDAMEEREAAAWWDPELVLDDAGRRRWSDLSPGERAGRMRGVWALADPLLIVPGNDRLTEHWARRTVSRIRERARNPYGMSWGSDLEELTVRYGWEVAWERAEPSPYALAEPAAAIGRHHPERRPLMPPGEALEDPWAAPEAGWIPDPRRPRATHAPQYAAVVLPGAGRVAVFPRGERIAVVGAWALPEDTSRHDGHAHPARDSVPPTRRGLPDEAGLFLISPDDQAGPVHEVRAVGGESGGLLLEAPAGRWVASLEVFSPARRSCARRDRPTAAPPRHPHRLRPAARGRRALTGGFAGGRGHSGAAELPHPHGGADRRRVGAVRTRLP